MTWEHQFLELLGKKEELGYTHQRIPKVNLEEQVKISEKGAVYKTAI